MTADHDRDRRADPAQGWEELLQPGKSDRYFVWPGSHLPPLRHDVTVYDPVNAWWLAELSRLVYRHERRSEHLDRVGLVEVHRAEQSSTQCTIFEPAGSDAPFSIAVFEGTADLRDWFINLDAAPISWEPGGRVHQGFAKALLNVWGDVEPRLPRDRPTFYAGHSLGGALTTLACSLRQPSAAYTFGSPRVGDARFVRTVRHTALYRVVLHRDVVPTLPPSDVLRFQHAGQLRYISGDGSMLTDPPPESLASDRAAKPRLPAGWQDLLQPAGPLADHAPLRYVEALAALAAPD